MTETPTDLAECKTGEELCDAITERVEALKRDLSGLGVCIVVAFEVEDALDDHNCHFRAGWLASPCQGVGLARMLERHIDEWAHTPDGDDVEN